MPKFAFVVLEYSAVKKIILIANTDPRKDSSLILAGNVQQKSVQ
jgi:hypothetical protein